MIFFFFFVYRRVNQFSLYILVIGHALVARRQRVIYLFVREYNYYVNGRFEFDNVVGRRRPALLSIQIGKANRRVKFHTE